jgi:hypothetical protein
MNDQRLPQVKLAVAIIDRGALVTQYILVPGETKMADLDEAVCNAVREQTIYDGSSIHAMSLKFGG